MFPFLLCLSTSYFILGGSTINKEEKTYGPVSISRETVRSWLKNTLKLDDKIAEDIYMSFKFNSKIRKSGSWDVYKIWATYNSLKDYHTYLDIYSISYIRNADGKTYRFMATSIKRNKKDYYGEKDKDGNTVYKLASPSLQRLWFESMTEYCPEWKDHPKLVSNPSTLVQRH